jgi:hypothetical protein
MICVNKINTNEFTILKKKEKYMHCNETETVERPERIKNAIKVVE